MNVRDLGGLPLERGGETRTRALVRADSLHRLTHEGRRALLAYGVRTIIDLRHPKETEREPNPYAAPRDGARYFNLPLVSDEAQRSLEGIDDRAEVNARILDGSRSNVAGIVRQVAAATGGAVVFHCAVGKDRSGLVAAVLLALAGAAAEAIADDYAASEVSLRALRDEVIARAEPALRERLLSQWAAPREAILATLEHVERRYGGMEGYLRSTGLTDEELGLARARLA
jgi:protein-tyrosine phosphatase